MRDAVIVEAVRTATGKRNGGLSGVQPADLSALVLVALAERTGIDPAQIDKVGQGRAYPQVMGDVKADFTTTDDYQASYLITQAVDELCPALIWQLRNTAAHYRQPAQ